MILSKSLIPVLAAAVALPLAAAGLPPVTVDGNYFSREGRRFIPVGAHWVPAKAALAWPLKWNPKEIEADFAKMHELGFNTVRLDLFWAWFEPRPGDYNPVAFEQFDYLVSLAHRYQLYLHPCLFVGGEVGEAYWDVSWRHGRHPHADPEMLRLETNHAAELARRYAKESAILAWDLTDEPPFWIVASSTTDAMAINWTRLIAGAIRRHDQAHAIVAGTSMEDVSHGPFRPDNLRDEVDFLSVHPYTIYSPRLFPDAMLSERGSYGGSFQTALSGGARKPVMVQELGVSSAQYDPERAAAFDRITLYSSLAAGANGFLLWCFTDSAPEGYRSVPYLRAPHETQFGLTTWDGGERPRAAEFRKFEQIVARMDLDGVSPAPAEAGIIVPHEWSKPAGDSSRFGLRGPEILPYVSTQDGGAAPGHPQQSGADESVWISGSWLSTYILARRAGLKPDFPREYDDWDRRPAVFLPSPLTSTESNLVHVHTDFWEKARAYVEGGGFLYASLSADAAIPGMERIFGARLEDHAPVTDVTLRVTEPFATLKPGDTFRFSAGGSQRQWPATLRVEGGKIIAVDQDGRPALVAHSAGRGKTLLCAYPIESYLAVQPAAFDNDHTTHRIYRALREWAGLRPRFETDSVSVEVSALDGGNRGYAILANHGVESARTLLSSSATLKSASLVSADGVHPLTPEAGGWRISVEAHGGAVVAWTRQVVPASGGATSFSDPARKRSRVRTAAQAGEHGTPPAGR
jgi:beta-galactosidase